MFIKGIVDFFDDFLCEEIFEEFLIKGEND